MRDKATTHLRPFTVPGRRYHNRSGLLAVNAGRDPIEEGHLIVLKNWSTDDFRTVIVTKVRPATGSFPRTIEWANMRIER